MFIAQLPLPVPHHRNQQLFSDYYLNEILPQRTDWQQLIPQAAVAMQTISQIVAAYTPSSNEAQTEDGLITPVLQALGHTFEVQAALKTPAGTKKPDYLFYRDVAACNANKNQTLSDALPTQAAIAVGDAKYWDRPLDVTLKTAGGDPFTNKNPAYQIDFYIRHSGLTWGILTNGRLWRLYHKDSAHKLDRYYEVNLPDLLALEQPAAFLYFYAFFCRAAFDDHPLGLNHVLRASSDFAHGISENLKQQVYTALRLIAQGFLDYPPNQLSADEATLKTIYDHSLIVLYRLLFLFYAEARELLPLRTNQSYRLLYSLAALKQQVVQHCDSSANLRPTTAMLWPHLQTLFGIINTGDAALQVATFDGGLFDPTHHPFLEQKAVGDARLVQALDMLARVDGKFIDYRDLAERHLGTIYEGLLEYHLEPSPQPAAFTVDLLNAKGERKASGSYYTPDYIVKYMVEQTVGPALRRAVASASSDSAQIEAILAINVCDPAMGSGHFLVEATEYIARFLVDLAITPDGDAQGEADLAYWKRRVVQNCIYGVDLNPLAVDLAKLSLWLVTVAKDKPLSFLDHHLRCGNALIGARMDHLRLNGTTNPNGPSKKTQAAVAAGQLLLLDDDTFRQNMSSAVDTMWLIEAKPANTIDEVKAQEQIYAELRTNLTHKYGRLANLITAQHFGLHIPPDLRNALTDYATGRNIVTMRQITELLDQADTIAEQRHFFHWELEFPEIFFDKHGYPRGEHAGFDVVVGNPPYVRAETADKDQRNYIINADVYTTVWGRFDVYAIFIEKGLQLLQKHGSFAYIVPAAVLTINYAQKLREWLITHKTLRTIVDARGENVFPGVAVSPCILIVDNVEPALDHWTEIVSLPQFRKGSFRKNIQQKQFQTMAGSAFHISTTEIDDKIRQHIVSVSANLATHCYFTTGLVGHHPQTGASVDRLIRSSAINSSCKPYIEAKEWGGRYSWLQPTHYIEYLPDEMHRPKYPELFEVPKILIQRISSGKTIPVTLDEQGVYVNHVINCCIKAEVFVQMDKKVNYDIDLFELPNYYDLYFLLAIIASSLIGYYHNKFLSPGVDIFPETLRQIPIRRIAFITPEPTRTTMREQGVAFFTSGRLAELGAFCQARLDCQPEQSDVIHDILAYLARQMLDLHRQRQQALENFTLDLEGVLAPGQLEHLSRLYTVPRPPKPGDNAARAKQAKYLADLASAQAQLGDLATQNLDLRTDIGRINEAQWKWLLKARLKHKLGSMADLVAVYRQRQPAIATLDTRITLTDHLIDQIVFSLYGLSAADIALIAEA